MKRPGDDKIKTKESANACMYTHAHTDTHTLSQLKLVLKLQRREGNKKLEERSNLCYMKHKGRSVSTEYYVLEIFTKEMKQMI